MDVLDIAEAVRSWAVARPRIRAAFLFGSRARGAERRDSDIDIALLIDDAPDDPAAAYWIFEAEEMRSELQPLLAQRLDLQIMKPSDKRVWPAVEEYGIGLYIRSGAPRVS